MSAARESDCPADGAHPPQEDRAWPSPGPEPIARTRPRSGIVIGRYQTTVVVTVHGELDHPRAAHLRDVLTDLIDGQGNLSLRVDLHDATAADARHLPVLADADERARRRGGSLTLSKPPVPLHDALRGHGLGHLVEVVPNEAECAPAAEGSSRRERQAHPAGGSPSVASGGSHQ